MWLWQTQKALFTNMENFNPSMLSKAWDKNTFRWGSNGSCLQTHETLLPRTRNENLQKWV